MNLTLPLPTPTAETTTDLNEIVYAEDFKNTDLFKLGWCCITGASVPYKAAQLELQNSCCMLTTNEEDISVCEFLQPRKLYKTGGYSLVFTGELQGEDAACGLFWNEEAPMKRELENVWWLPLPKNQPVTVRLYANGAKQTATLYIDEEAVESLPYIPTVQHGLYFVLRSAALILKRIEVIAK